jgi:uncharacterized protein YoxC
VREKSLDVKDIEAEKKARDLTFDADITGQQARIDRLHAQIDPITDRVKQIKDQADQDVTEIEARNTRISAAFTAALQDQGRITRDIQDERNTIADRYAVKVDAGYRGREAAGAGDQGRATRPARAIAAKG